MWISETFRQALTAPGTHVHIVTIGTKPDIIKQAPVYHALKAKGVAVFAGHTGQHYDYNLSQSLLEELNIEVAFNYEIDGTLHERIGGMWRGTGEIITLCEAHKKIPVFYVHGDTFTASAVGSAAFAAHYPAVHIEAGIRTLTLKADILERFMNGDIDWNTYKALHKKEESYVHGSVEPFPEQYNTRTTEAASGMYITPTDLATANVLREGFPAERIVEAGNTISDITRDMLAKVNASQIFEQYPVLKNGFIRFCIHRRENCARRERFVAIFEAMERLAANGHVILLTMLNATKTAVEQFGLQDRLAAFAARENVLVTDVWPSYLDVIAAMSQSTMCVTDSGSMQEEMHIMRVPCVTLRYGSDRPETLLVGSNVLAAPHSAEHVYRVVSEALKDRESLRHPDKELYGRDVSAAIADAVIAQLEKTGSLFRDEYDLHG